MMPITVRLKDSLEKRLDELAKLTGRTKAIISGKLWKKSWTIWKIYISPNTELKSLKRIDGVWNN